MSLLRIDAGTTGGKSAVVPESGALLALAYVEYDYVHAQPLHVAWRQAPRVLDSKLSAHRGEELL